MRKGQNRIRDRRAGRRSDAKSKKLPSFRQWVPRSEKLFRVQNTEKWILIHNGEAHNAGPKIAQHFGRVHTHASFVGIGYNALLQNRDISWKMEP